MRRRIEWSATAMLSAFIAAGASGAGMPDRIAIGALDAPREYISVAQQQEVWDRSQRNIAILRAQGRLTDLKAGTAVKLGWPTRLASGRPEFLDHVISNYVDHDPAADSLRDFNCGVRTYDTATGGHRGTDISLGRRAFYKQDTEQTVVVAAAGGTIVMKDDANPDRSCGSLAVLFASNLRNNVISIRHNDGTLGIYYHVKAGSLTAKSVGDAVVEGEYLGAIGSSGSSSAPHLHFEVRGADNAVIDPWAGACNPGSPDSWWKAQQPYIVKEIVSLMPTATEPADENLSTPCIDNIAEDKPASGYLQPDLYAQPGLTHYFVAFVRDIEAGDKAVSAFRRPNGTQYSSATVTGTTHLSSAHFVLTRTIPASEPAGRWSFEVTYGGKTKSTPFYFKVPAPAAARVYEFFNPALNHYFRTAAKEEADSLTPASGFLPTGDDFFALDRTVSLAGVMPVCRFYGSPNPGPNSHFYTADPAECQALKDIQARTPPGEPRWNYEETAFAAWLPVAGLCPPEAPFPIYRLYNRHHGETVFGTRADSNHRFTTLSSIYYQMSGQGWSREGVVMCSGSKP